MSTDTLPSMADHARSVLADETRALALDDAGYSPLVRANVEDHRAAVEDILSAGAELERQLAEVERDRDLYNPQGVQRLRRERIDLAEQAVAEAGHRAERALAELRVNLGEAVIPRVPTEREHLARQELAMLLDARGQSLVSTALAVANGESREALAALLSPFGRALLMARGVTGIDLEQVMRSVRTIAVQTADLHPGRHTGAELTAAAALRSVDGLATATTFARQHVSRVAGG
jgi:hypothetical protein